MPDDQWVDHAKRLSDWFIGAKQIDITIHRPTRVSDGAGGVEETGTTVLDPQTVRLVEEDETSARTAQGTLVASGERYIVIAPVDADIEEHDRFQNPNGLWLVVDRLFPERAFRKRAEVNLLDH